MSRVETIGSATLYCGDALEIVGTLDAPNVLLTDPVWPNCPPSADIANAEAPWTLWQRFWSVMPTPSRAVIVMRCDSDPRFLRAVPDELPFFRSMQLPYVIPGYLGRALGGDETAYWYGSVVRSVPGRRVIPGRGPAAQPGNRMPNGHPMSRAQVHFDWLTDWASDDDETICDPFMGSGTTGVSAVKLGKPFVGIEMIEKYFDIACRRIEEAYRQRDLFAKQPDVIPTARDMFAEVAAQ